ncbi:MotA/TolQ/ExbB proton channel family protein [Treponema parvum]|uniref:MotA/TolQ/ExbB proton channel family protein n=1 Tax=Treponema parvum TaxID=138851 RepID=A0A975F0Q8_9SPIR|nr:MotA/TolQ/ExbB proton channel family protein [Treponema parvum]QTQ12364.1 MotA/TolQ/ExbB proton channel family protein [Treponema parvum]
MFDLLRSGGLLMIPIFLCAVAGTFIIIERSYYFFSIKKRDGELNLLLDKSLMQNDFQTAQADCVAAGTPAAQVIKKALECRRWAEDDLKEAVSAEMNAVIPQFEHLLTPLGTIANISTLLGLLGTVTGNIKAFGVLSAGGSMGDPASLAGAIGEALLTTAAGLSVSIPALIFHNYFVSRVNRRIAEMESAVTSVLLRLSGRIR